jgi:hypothetical protein
VDEMSFECNKFECGAIWRFDSTLLGLRIIEENGYGEFFNSGEELSKYVCTSLMEELK